MTELKGIHLYADLLRKMADKKIKETLNENFTLASPDVKSPILKTEEPKILNTLNINQKSQIKNSEPKNNMPQKIVSKKVENNDVSESELKNDQKKIQQKISIENKINSMKKDLKDNFNSIQNLEKNALNINSSNVKNNDPIKDAQKILDKNNIKLPTVKPEVMAKKIKDDIKNKQISLEKIELNTNPKKNQTQDSIIEAQKTLEKNVANEKNLNSEVVKAVKTQKFKAKKFLAANISNTLNQAFEQNGKFPEVLENENVKFRSLAENKKLENMSDDEFLNGAIKEMNIKKLNTAMANA